MQSGALTFQKPRLTFSKETTGWSAACLGQLRRLSEGQRPCHDKEEMRSAVLLSDVQKPYAKKMQYLATEDSEYKGENAEIEAIIESIRARSRTCALSR